MFSKEESAVLLEFLDRVTIKGHQERSNMNLLVEKIVYQGRVPNKTDNQTTAEDIYHGNS